MAPSTERESREAYHARWWPKVRGTATPVRRRPGSGARSFTRTSAACTTSSSGTTPTPSGSAFGRGRGRQLIDLPHELVTESVDRTDTAKVSDWRHRALAAHDEVPTATLRGKGQRVEIRRVVSGIENPVSTDIRGNGAECVALPPAGNPRFDHLAPWKDIETVLASPHHESVELVRVLECIRIVAAKVHGDRVLLALDAQARSLEVKRKIGREQSKLVLRFPQRAAIGGDALEAM